MFILQRMQQTIRVPPASLNPKTTLKRAIMQEIDTIYCNRVVLDIGLVIRTFDIISIGDPLVHPGDPSICIDTVFRFIVFRPFVNEILVAQIKGSSADGLKLSLGFFDDIYIPCKHFPEGTTFDPSTQHWTWLFHQDETSDGIKLSFSLGQLCRFRVNTEAFSDVAASSQTNASVSAIDAPYKLIGDLTSDGLGLVSWWD